MRISIALLTNVLFSATSLFAQALPSFDKAAEQIVEAGAFLHRSNLCPATSGNISVRTDSGLIAITSSGKHKGALKPADIMLVDLDGIAIDKNRKPSAETLLHTLVYSFYPEAGAVIHTHTLYGTVLSRMVAPNTELVTVGYELHKVFPGITTHESTLHIPIFENSQNMALLAEEVEGYLTQDSNVYGFLIRDHGLYTWGRDMNEAKNRIEAFEYLFESELLIRR